MTTIYDQPLDELMHQLDEIETIALDDVYGPAEYALIERANNARVIVEQLARNLRNERGY